jgi:hypothetical protein
MFAPFVLCRPGLLLLLLCCCACSCQQPNHICAASKLSKQHLSPHLLACLRGA